MYRTSNRLIFSATDLVDFLHCEHLTQQELAASIDLITLPDGPDEMAEVLRKRGSEHEAAYLQLLRDSGRRVVEIERVGADLESLRQANAATVAAMRRGEDVIYQAALFDGRWLGYADFLLRVDTPSGLGDFSYEVADTKLARTVKASAIIQMCSYAEHLTRVQGREPEQIHVVLGDMRMESHRLRDYAAYYRALKQRFETNALAESMTPTYPNPVDHCGVCRWKDVCDQRRRTDDHLSLVARMRSDQVRKLDSASIETVFDLSRAPSSPSGIGTSTFEALRAQARLQLDQRQTGEVTYELLPPTPKLGLALLPMPSPGDLFFDVEGDPLVQDGGLEYLFGFVEIQANGNPRYQALWAHGRHEEKLAFESFIDLVTKRLERHPDLHVYHYAAYEPTTLKRLMGTYGTREAEMDQLLRGGVFVDLYQIVRQGVRVSQESYSLKKLEPLYMPPREGAITDGGSSIVAYERWLERPDPGILDAIAAYNADDCCSAWQLRNWLEERRDELNEQNGVDLPRPTASPMAPSEPQREAEARVAALTKSLSVGVPEDRRERTADEHARWLLAQLLQWHRREDKPEWWWYFKRLRMTDAELVEDGDAIGELDYVGIKDEIGKSYVHRYKFDPAQEHKIGRGKDTLDPRTERSAGEIVAIDTVNGTIDLRRGFNSKAPHPRSLIPGRPLENVPLRAALERVARWVVDNGIDAPGPFRAACDLLRGLAPRVRSVTSGAPLRREGEPALDTARRLVAALDHSYLAIQGPPGSGKTFTGARMIVDLVRAGNRVGICGPSHRAIGNLLDEVMRHTESDAINLQAIQKVPESDKCSSPNVTIAVSNAEVEDALRDNTVDIVAGTAWLFAREEMADALDILFVDEAGQVSLANTVAIAGAARNLVLLGDPRQLSQPLKGMHPGGTERSALEHVLGDQATVAPDKGLLLDTTWRMHPVICDFISDIAYDCRLGAAACCATQELEGGVGLRYVPVQHVGNRTSSGEEADTIACMVGSLLGRNWTDAQGHHRELTLDDILVVAPYNAQVAALARRLPDGARVGTVDKFQGQEAPVVFFSTAASSVGDVPRGMEFLFSLNRLNVAISRARGLAILIANPSLLSLSCGTPERMRLANAFCRFMELGQTTQNLGLEQSRGSGGRSHEAGA